MLKKNARKRITVCNGLSIRGASQRLVDALLKLNEFPNPDYLSASRYGSEYALQYIPEKINLTVVTNPDRPYKRVVGCPRGTPFHLLPPAEAEEFKNMPVSYKQHDVEARWGEEQLTLSDEQEKVKSAFMDAYQRDLRPYGNYLIIAATSFGKSITAMSICKYLGRRALVIYNTNLIKEAWLKDIEKLFGIPPKEVGIIQGAKFKIGEQITLASVQTLNRNQDSWEDIFSNFGILVVDEADLMGKNTMTSIVYECNCRFVLGMSATLSPENPYKKLFTRAFDKPIIKVNSTAGKDTKTSMALRDFEVIPTNFEYHGDVDKFGASFDESGERIQRSMDYNNLLECIAYDEDRNQLIVDKIIEELREDSSIIVVCKRVGHAEMITSILEERGQEAYCYTGRDNVSKKNSRAIVDKFLSRKLKCLVTIDSMIQRGANLNVVDRMFIVAPIKKKTAIHQLVGRLRRRSEGKKDNKIYYFLDERVSFLKSAYYKVVLPAIEKEGVVKYKKPIL